MMIIVFIELVLVSLGDFVVGSVIWINIGKISGGGRKWQKRSRDESNKNLGR